MIRYLLLSSFVAFLCIYAWKDWYRSLCGLVMMMAFSERYDMPRTMFGVYGLNPWNVLFMFVLMAWLVSRRKEKLQWDLPPLANWLLVAYLGAVLVAVARTMSNTSDLVSVVILSGVDLPIGFSLFADSILNSLKYAVPGLLFYHGCNSSKRFWWGSAAILVSTFILALQIIKWMPLSAIADADALQKAALRLLDTNIGYHRVDLAAISASAAWAFFLLANLTTEKLRRVIFFGCGLITTFALLLTAGRTGYATWVIIGLVLAAVRYRRYLFVLPVLLVVAVAVVPAVQDRLFEGVRDSSADSQFYSNSGGVDFEAVTSDRTLVWPTVIEKITEEPLVGYGRYGFFLSGAREEIVDKYGEAGAFPHPHNAYLEFLIDTGLIGTIPVLLFFGLVYRRSMTLLKVRDNKIAVFAGILGLSFVLGQLIASLGSQSFYPRSGVVMMWCAIGLTLRVHGQYFRSASSPNKDTLF